MRWTCITAHMSSLFHCSQHHPHAHIQRWPPWGQGAGCVNGEQMRKTILHLACLDLVLAKIYACQPLPFHIFSYYAISINGIQVWIGSLFSQRKPLVNTYYTRLGLAMASEFSEFWCKISVPVLNLAGQASSKIFGINEFQQSPVLHVKVNPSTPCCTYMWN